MGWVSRSLSWVINTMAVSRSLSLALLILCCSCRSPSSVHFLLFFFWLIHLCLLHNSHVKTALIWQTHKAGTTWELCHAFRKNYCIHKFVRFRMIRSDPDTIIATRHLAHKLPEIQFFLFCEPTPFLVIKKRVQTIQSSGPEHMVYISIWDSNDSNCQHLTSIS